MEQPVVTIIGVGLIGGSIALKLRSLPYAKHVIGVEANEQHAQKALTLGLVDEILPLAEAVKHSTVVIIATPVNAALQVIKQVLPHVTHQTVLDVGSTKVPIVLAAADFSQASNFVPTHPMWGTEFSGPEAATADAFTNKAVVICSHPALLASHLQQAVQLYQALGMHIVHMTPEEHDVHVAYVSHVSHITSFALANTVLEKEKEENTIFELASGGFESTVRLAKSTASMWVPILQQNRDNVLDVLNEHITQLRKFKTCLEKENYAYLAELIEQANSIKKALKQ